MYYATESFSHTREGEGLKLVITALIRGAAPYLSHEATEEDEEPGAEEAAPAVESCGPVDDDDVDGGEEENEGHFTDSLGQVVG